MPDYTVSCDAGNGGVKAILATPKGFKQFYEPSVRAAATGDSLGLGKQWEMQYEYVDWYGHRYITGDDVIRVNRKSIERHMGAARYGNEFHQFLVAVALAKLGVKEGSVDLTLFAPPGLYNDMKPHMIERFRENGGEVVLKLKGDKKPRKWCYENVTVWPEGLGAAACFVLDDNGEFAPSDVLDGETVVLDFGAHTLDALQLSNGNFNPEGLQTATWEIGGIHAHIREPILRDVKKKGGDDFAGLTVDDIDRVIRLGSASGDYTLTVAGYDVDLKPLLEKHRRRFADWVGNNICDGVFSGFRGIKSVILVGGSDLVEDHMREWYGSKILDRKSHPTTKRLHPIDMNAVGGMRLALARLKQLKKAG
jgi:hypothetical protein